MIYHSWNEVLKWFSYDFIVVDYSTSLRLFLRMIILNFFFFFYARKIVIISLDKVKEGFGV